VLKNSNYRFANYLRIVLPGNDPVVTELAARALGKLALPGGPLTLDFVEFEVKRALEWLSGTLIYNRVGDRNEQRRYAAVLVLKELANNSSTLLYSFVSQILDLIWIPLRDQKVSIREGAAEGLAACLKLVSIRQNQIKRQLYKRLLEEAQKGLKQNQQPDVIHGSLLALGQISLHLIKANDSRLKEIISLVLQFRDHRDSLVRKTVINLIPSLAKMDPDLFFKENYQSASVMYLTSQLKKEKERNYGNNIQT
jgi:FKBP12-rapamycin complex-associated protein